MARRGAAALLLFMFIFGALAVAAGSVGAQSASPQHVKVTTDVILSREESGGCYGFKVGFSPGTCYFAVEDDTSFGSYAPQGAPAMTGTLTFSWKSEVPNGGSITISPKVCTIDSNGGCDVTINGTAGGLVSLTGTYSGDANYYGSTATDTLVVTQGVSDMSLSCGVISVQSGTFAALGSTTCYVTGGIGGTVTFTSSTLQVQPQTDCSGACAEVTGGAPGDYFVTATYSGSKYSAPAVLTTEVKAFDQQAPAFSSMTPSLSCGLVGLFVGGNMTRCYITLNEQVTSDSTFTISQTAGPGRVRFNSSGDTISCAALPKCYVDIFALGAGDTTISIAYSGDSISGVSTDTLFFFIYM